MWQVCFAAVRATWLHVVVKPWGPEARGRNIWPDIPESVGSADTPTQPSVCRGNHSSQIRASIPHAGRCYSSCSPHQAISPTPSPKELCPASLLVTKLITRIKFQLYLAGEVPGLIKERVYTKKLQELTGRYWQEPRKHWVCLSRVLYQEGQKGKNSDLGALSQYTGFNPLPGKDCWGWAVFTKVALRGLEKVLATTKQSRNTWAVLARDQRRNEKAEVGRYAGVERLHEVKNLTRG